MKNIYFIQVGFAFDKSVYLPYATGTIVAYCKNQPDIASEYDFKEIIFRRDDIEKVVSGMESPYLVAFSTYVWNVEYNKALARAVKEKYPDVNEKELIDILNAETTTENSLAQYGYDIKDDSFIKQNDSDNIIYLAGKIIIFIISFNSNIIFL